MTDERSIADPRQQRHRRARHGIGAESKSQPVAIPRRPGPRQHECWSGSHEFAQMSMEEMDLRMSRSRDMRNGLRNGRPVSQSHRSAFSAATTGSSTSNHSSNCGSAGAGAGAGAAGGDATGSRSGGAGTVVAADQEQQYAAAAAAGRSFGGRSAHIDDGMYGGSAYRGSVYSGSPQYYHYPPGARRRSRNEHVYTVGSHQHFHVYGSSPPSYSPVSRLRTGGALPHPAGRRLHRDDRYDAYAAAAAAAAAGGEEGEPGKGRGGVVGGDGYDEQEVNSDGGGDNPGNDDEDGICDGVFNLELL